MISARRLARGHLLAVQDGAVESNAPGLFSGPLLLGERAIRGATGRDPVDLRMP